MCPGLRVRTSSLLPPRGAESDAGTSRPLLRISHAWIYKKIDARWLSISGTLVVAIPCADGFVVSADSRTKIRDKFVDGRRKLHVAPTNAPLVFAITGSPDFADPLPPGMAPEDWLPVATYAFRGKDVVASHLAQRHDFILSLPTLIEVAQTLGSGAGAFLSRWKDITTKFAGHGLCRLVLCQVDPVNQESLYGSVPIVVSSDSAVTLGDPRFLRYRATDDKDLQLNGEGEYVTEHILRDGAAGLSSCLMRWSQRGEARPG